jgi:hypothetical protein
VVAPTAHDPVGAVTFVVQPEDVPVLIQFPAAVAFQTNVAVCVWSL